MTYGRIILLVFLFNTLKGTTQKDPNFTKDKNKGQVINSVNVGILEKLGFSNIIRKQWVGIHLAPSTKAISIHSPLGKEGFMGRNVFINR